MIIKWLEIIKLISISFRLTSIELHFVHKHQPTARQQFDFVVDIDYHGPLSMLPMMSSNGQIFLGFEPTEAVAWFAFEAMLCHRLC